MRLINPDSIWLPIKQACRSKKVTLKSMMKAIEQDKITAHQVSCLNTIHIFVEVDKKYKEFTPTSLLKLDLNALIAFTNARSKKRNTRVRTV